MDTIKRFLAYEGKINIICANTSKLIEKARQIHDLSPLATATLGRTLIIGLLMGQNMKNDSDLLTIQIKGNGPIGRILVTANSKAKVRGYVENNIVDLPLREDGKLNVGEAVGKQGLINVIKDIGLKEPYIGISPIITGEIAEDFAHYFAISEQNNTAVALGVLVNKNGVKTAGGYIIQAMPDATEEIITKLEENLNKTEQITNMLENKLTLEEIAKKISGDEKLQEIGEEIIPEYKCECSIEKIKKGIASLGKEEIKKIIEEDQKAEIVCKFCQNKYIIKKEELEEMIK